MFTKWDIYQVYIAFCKQMEAELYLPVYPRSFRGGNSIFSPWRLSRFVTKPFTSKCTFWDCRCNWLQWVTSRRWWNREASQSWYRSWHSLETRLSLTLSNTFYRHASMLVGDMQRGHSSVTWRYFSGNVTPTHPLVTLITLNHNLRNAFFGMSENPHPPTVLRNTWMAPKYCCAQNFTQSSNEVMIWVVELSTAYTIPIWTIISWSDRRWLNLDRILS